MAGAAVRTILLASILGSTGCLSCNLMYAPSMVTFQVAGGDWPAGTYEFEAQGFNQFAMCVVTLPSNGSESACTGNASVLLDEAGERIVGFEALEFAPESFVVELKHDGELVAEELIEPDYASGEPNGPGCGVRSVATVDLDLG